MTGDCEKFQAACREMNEATQILAQAIGGFPWFCDDQKNWPNTTERDGVCTGEHTCVTIAQVAADTIRELREKLYHAYDEVVPDYDSFETKWEPNQWA